MLLDIHEERKKPAENEKKKQHKKQIRYETPQNNKKSQNQQHKISIHLKWGNDNVEPTKDISEQRKKQSVIQNGNNILIGE